MKLVKSWLRFFILHRDFFTYNEEEHFPKAVNPILSRDNLLFPTENSSA